MPTKGKTDKELWDALRGLEDDLLDPNLPEAILDDELKEMGIDPAALAKRGSQFVAKVKEEERLSWQTRAKERHAQLQARAAKAKVPANMDRRAMLAQLDELRTTDPKVGTAITMAARKRKPEESSDDELRALLEQVFALRAIEGDDLE